jgi:putative ABC transport system permease protein
MKSRRMPLLWKWTLRDIRERWLQVVGIALIIALGVAVSSGMGSSIPWRIKSFAKSYEMLNMFDLRLELTQGSYLDAAQLEGAVRSIPHADWIADVSVRLTLPTSVDASTPDQYLLVTGEVVGVDVTQGPAVNKLHVTEGRGLVASDSGQPVCVVEQNFANFHKLQPGDRLLRIGGGHTLEPVGYGISAEHFMVVEEESGVLGAMAQERFAVLFVPLETAQDIIGVPGGVNEAVITVADGLEEADLDQLKVELKENMARTFPELGIGLEKRSENRAFRVLDDDIKSDKELLDGIAALMLLGAGFGAFILIGRIVDAQRREIGINMALGVPPRRIARRYLLIGAQIAVLGMVLGAILGLLINQPLASELNKLMPLPYLDSSFQTDLYLRSAFIGLLIPFMAVLYPIWRAVRVAPVDAIQTGYLVSKGGGLAPLLARIPLPGSSFTLFPVRNLSRGVRRTVMTILGLSIAIVVLVAVIGMIDTFYETLAVGRAEIEQDAPERTMVVFDDFYPLSGSLVSGITANDRVAQAVPAIVLPGELSATQTFDVFIQMMELDNDLWTPTLERGGTHAEGPGILINEKAARDLGVDVGDSLTLRHPYREGEYAWRMAQTEVKVMGIHRDILRVTAYMDLKDATIMNLEGVVNSLQVNPVAGVDVKDLHRAISQTAGVATVRQPAAAMVAIEGFLDQYLGIFLVLQLIVLVMAFLIAFNTTRTNMEERQRDIATMFAFGTRVRTVIRMAIVENLVTGVLGTALGVGLGWLVLNTSLKGMFESDAPELDAIFTLAPGTFGWAVLIGVVVVAVTPVFLTRRLVKMDIPSTLRVIE